ncbi:MAG: tetratricopeptide (TPR) repeat protein [Saprospiraceae bacterium]|jgi:tetratricopeptide (TPR) repeat protein
MNISKKDFNAYVEGTLSMKQKQSIDDYLIENPAEHRALKGAIEYEKNNDFTELLEALNQKLSPHIDSEVFTKNQPELRSGRVIPFRKSMVPFVAAAAAIVLLIFTVIGSKNNYQGYLDNYPDVITTSVRGDLPIDELTVLEKGMLSYNNKDMQQALDFYNQHLFNDPTDTKARFYRAISELHLNNPEASLREFEIISKSGNILQFEDGVEWFKALSFIALERYSEAIPLLKKISESRHYKRKQANALLRKID